MKKSIYLIMVVIVIITTILSVNYYRIINNTAVVDDKQSIIEQPKVREFKDYNVYIESVDYVKGLYEPIDASCYLGGYVLSNKFVDFSMVEYDKLTDKDHALYIRNMRLGETVNQRWILECVSEIKTPFIVINPPNKWQPFQTNLIEQTAKELSNYYVPIMVLIYPDPTKICDNYEDYKKFYIETYKTLKKYAPNISIVWSTNYNKIYEEYLYYPGDEYVDWIGTDIILSADSIQNYKGIDAFYELYQQKKPLMISRLMVSHYSEQNHKYYIEEKNNLIKDIFSTVKNNYPRIKALNYIDLAVVDQSSLLDNYKRIVDDDYYVGDIQDDMKRETIQQTFNYKFELLQIGDDLYVDYRQIKVLDIDENAVSQLNNVYIFNNHSYYLLSDIDKISEYSIIVEKNNIFIHVGG